LFVSKFADKQTQVSANVLTNTLKQRTTASAFLREAQSGGRAGGAGTRSDAVFSGGGSELPVIPATWHRVRAGAFERLALVYEMRLPYS